MKKKSRLKSIHKKHLTMQIYVTLWLQLINSIHLPRTVTFPTWKCLAADSNAASDCDSTCNHPFLHSFTLSRDAGWTCEDIGGQVDMRFRLCLETEEGRTMKCVRDPWPCDREDGEVWCSGEDEMICNGLCAKSR